MSQHRDDDDRHRAVHLGLGMSSPLWTAVWFSVGLGASYWWWSKLTGGALRPGVTAARPAPQGPSPERARPGWAGQSGEAPVEVGAPELIMSHAPTPADAPDHPSHPSDRRIAEAPPEMLAHAPPESVGVSFKPRTGFVNPTHDPDSVFPKAASEADGSGGGGIEARDLERIAKPTPNRSEAKPAGIAATQAGRPVFDVEALATETSVAALTDGETMDETAAPLQAIGEPSPAPAPKPRSRRKPGTAPEA